MTTVAITGVAHYWGELLAICLQEDPRIERILALDPEAPEIQLGKLEHIQVDLRNPVLPDILETNKVEVLFHTDIVKRRVYNEAVFQHNLLGTMHLFSSCANAGVKRIVLKSSIRVYGARYDNPNFIPEDWALRSGHTYQYNRDFYEIEKYCREFSQDHPEVDLVTLRFGHGLGPTARTPMSKYLGAKFIPTLLGFDPLFQIVHEDDLVRALYQCLERVPAGVYNVASDGVLPLSKILRRTGRISVPLPHPAAYRMMDTAKLLRLTNPFPLEIDYLRYSCVASNKRMKDQMGFTPQYTSEEALDDYVKYHAAPGKLRFDNAYHYVMQKKERIQQLVKQDQQASAEQEVAQ